MFSRMLAARHRQRPGTGAQPDSGFVLLESIAAITVITIVMAALTTLLVTVTHSTSSQRGAQTGAQLAVSALDKANALGGIDAVRGRDTSSSNTQWNSDLAKSAAVAPWLASMAEASDSTANANAGTDPKLTALPTAPVTQVVNGTSFDTNYFVGYCWRPAVRSGDCVERADLAQTAQSAADPSTWIQAEPVEYVRVVVVLVWQATGCPSIGCTYVSATVLNGLNDPVFNFDQSGPAAPVLITVPTQNTVLGQAVNGVQGVAGCDSPCPISATGGVAPLIFSGTVQYNGGTAVQLPTNNPCLQSDASPSGTPTSTPTGAPASPSGAPTSPTSTPSSSPSGSGPVPAAYGFWIDPTCGLITGTPTQAGTYQFTITVTDAFLNTDQTTFLWKVGTAGLAFTAPGNQTNVVGDKVNLAVGGATGGTAPYKWSATGLPPTLTMDQNTGVISGTVTAGSATPYTVAVTLADSAGTKPVTQSFTWTIPVVGPTIAAPSPTASIVWWPVSSTAAYSCPSGSCSFSLSGNPSWLKLATTSTLSKSGSVALTGTPSTVTNYSGIKLTITDQKNATKTASVTFGWTVNQAAKPTMDTIGSKTLGSSGLTVAPTYTCGTPTCTFSLSASKNSGSYELPSSFSYQNGWSNSAVGTYLTFDPKTGKFTVSSSLSGYSIGYWSYTVTITITDQSGQQAARSFTMSSS